MQATSPRRPDAAHLVQHVQVARRRCADLSAARQLARRPLAQAPRHERSLQERARDGLDLVVGLRAGGRVR